MNMLMFDRAVGEIRDRGFTSLSTLDARQDLQVIIQGFDALLSLPSSRDAFTVPSERWVRDELGEPYELGLLMKSGEQKGDGGGFFDRAAGRKQEDPDKALLHYSPALLVHLSERTRMEFCGFLLALERINKEALDLVAPIITEFESPHRDLRKRYLWSMVDRMQDAIAITRVIRYGASANASPDAQVHRDRCTFTVHRFATRSGLVVFDRTGAAYRVSETSTTNATIMTGEKFPAMTWNAFGLGVPHGVKDESRTRSSSPRFTVVTFVHLPLCPSDVDWVVRNKELLEIDQSAYAI